MKAMRMVVLAMGMALSVGATSVIAASGQDSSADTKTQASDKQLASDSWSALNRLYADQPSAKQLGEKSRAILVFPNIFRAGLVVGGQGGKGVLIEHGKVVGIYSLAAGSFGLQAGAQSFSQVVFLVTASAVNYLHSSNGWSLGVGPTVVVVDQGAAKSLTTQQLNSDAYVYIFGQQGLMAGLGIEGQKITRLQR